MRQIALDTETTGLSTAKGHRIIEIGCVEMINRRLTGDHFHVFVNPERDIDEGAQRVHGISREFLADKPVFEDVVDDFINYISGAELIIHNAEFDVGFLDHELQLMSHAKPAIEQHARVVDSLLLAREMHPGQRNSLDALCKRYEVDATQRDLHGALIDSELLANVYLAMTGGQAALLLDENSSESVSDEIMSANPALSAEQACDIELLVSAASKEETAAHNAMLEKIRKSGACVWDID